MIVNRRNLVKRAWADVVAYQRKKLKIIPLIEQGVKDYSQFERSLMEKIVELRNAVLALKKSNDGNIDDMKKLAAAENASKNLMTSLTATFENYPTLRTSDLYLKYFKELSENQENITAAITIFNRAVQEFNDGIQEFPGSIVNGIFNRERPVNEFTDDEASAEIGYKLNI